MPAAASSRSPATSTATPPRPTPTTRSSRSRSEARVVTSPFRLTPEGQALGFQDRVNGIGTEERHQLLPDAQLLPGACGRQRPPGRRARSGQPTRARDAVRGRHDQRRHDRQEAASAVVKLPSNRKCVSRRKFRIRIRQPGGIKIQTALVFVNGRRVATVKRRVFQKKRTIASVNLRGLPTGASRSGSSS